MFFGFLVFWLIKMDKIIKLQTHQEAQNLLGLHDAKARLIEKEFKVKLTLRGEHLKISGTSNNIKKASGLVEYILEAFRLGQEGAGKLDLAYLIANFKKPKRADSLKIPDNGITHASSGKQIGPKTNGQREYVESIKGNDIVFYFDFLDTYQDHFYLQISQSCLLKILFFY